MAPNHPRLLALFAGACAAAGANIAGAHIMTTRDGYALDTFLLNRAFKDDADELRRGKRIGELIGRLLRGDAWLDTLIAERGPPPRRVMAFTVEPDVIINNALSDQFTVIEVAGRDRPGLLYELTSTLSNLMLDITSAHITTFGEKAVDVFYVTDLTGKKVISDTRQETIRKKLEGVLDGSEKPGRDPPGLARHDQLDAAVELIEVFLAEVAAHDAGIRLRLALGDQLQAAVEAALAQKARDRLQALRRQSQVERIRAALVRMPGERDLGKALDPQVFEQQARGLAAVAGQVRLIEDEGDGHRHRRRLDTGLRGDRGLLGRRGRGPDGAGLRHLTGGRRRRSGRRLACSPRCAPRRPCLRGS